MAVAKSSEKSGGDPVLHETPESISRKYGWAFRKDVGVMLSRKFFALGDSRHDGVQDEAVAGHRDGVHNIAAEATAILAHHEDASASHDQIGSPVHEHYADSDPHASSAETFYPHARGSVVLPGSPQAHVKSARWQNRASGASSLMAALATLTIGGIIGVALLSGQTRVGPADAAMKSPLGASPAAAGSATGGQLSAGLLYDALTVGKTSPRGVSAEGVAAVKALENANVQLLASGAARDTDEGAFWLKQYIGSTLGDDRTVRVLTQLGTVYAEPGKAQTPDYAKARLLWEIAGAAGDPVAMCFLGLLHETGLGTPADKKISLQWYMRSKERGGCPNIEESLARVSR